jgi:hypothetical protein
MIYGPQFVPVSKDKSGNWIVTSNGRDTEMLRVAGPVSSGWYPAYTRDYSVAGDSWVDQDFVYVKEVNGGTFAVDDILLDAHLVGYQDSYRRYLAEALASSSGGGGSCTAVTFTESKVAGVVLYFRTLSLNIVAGCLALTPGDWYPVGCLAVCDGVRITTPATECCSGCVSDAPATIKTDIVLSFGTVTLDLVYDTDFGVWWAAGDCNGTAIEFEIYIDDVCTWNALMYCGANAGVLPISRASRIAGDPLPPNGAFISPSITTTNPFAGTYSGSSAGIADCCGGGISPAFTGTLYE